MNRVICLIFLVVSVVITCATASNFADEFAVTYKKYESFVELLPDESEFFLMGINDRRGGANGEYPQRKARVKPFRVMLYPVTVASFRRFKMEKTRFLTDAEKRDHSLVFDKMIHPDADIFQGWNDEVSDDDAKALRQHLVNVFEASWNRPFGGGSFTTRDNQTLPVVHVSYNDAQAFCAWKNWRLPSEIEWEYAARGGLAERPYPWGDLWQVGHANLWQGHFPDQNQLRDGFYGLSPVDAFAPQNSYEMYDVLGNVWEWTSTIYNNTSEDRAFAKRVLKGGSFMDSRDGEFHDDKVKIRISARIGQPPGYSALNVGFRCVQSIDNQEELEKAKAAAHGKKYRVVRLRPRQVIENVRTEL